MEHYPRPSLPSPPGHRAGNSQHPGAPGKCSQSRCTWHLSAEEAQRGALRKTPSSAMVVAFVLNAITIRVWISLENSGTEILGAVIYQGHICLP